MAAVHLLCQLRFLSLHQVLCVHVPLVEQSTGTVSCLVNRDSKLFLYRTTPKHGCFLLMSPWRCKQRSIFSTGADSSRCGVSVNQVCRSNCRVRSAKPQNPLSYDTKNNWTLTKYNAGRVKDAIFLFQGTKHEWRLEAWIKGWYLGRLDIDFSGMPLSPSFSVSP